jgi:hypothetical protein
MPALLSYVLATLVTIASAAGALSGRVYALEKPTWAIDQRPALIGPSSTRGLE